MQVKVDKQRREGRRGEKEKRKGELKMGLVYCMATP
jgi:hypothetical protein